MSIRNTALAWLRNNHHVTHGDIFTSKLFVPEHSWTGHDAWWIRLPIERLRRDGADFIHIVCELEPRKNEFHYLKVPCSYFLQHQHQFATIGKDKLNLFLSAQAENLFQEQRGHPNVRFQHFLVASKSASDKP